MAAVETKVPGYFTDKMTIGEAENDSDGFGTKTLVLKVRAVPRKPKSANLLVLWCPASLRWPRAFLHSRDQTTGAFTTRSSPSLTENASHRSPPPSPSVRVCSPKSCHTPWERKA